MMLVPGRNSFNLLDDFFDDEIFSKKERNLMKTDIREKKDKYIIDIDLPGFEKENINIALNNCYLDISAKIRKEENKSDEEKYVHRERFYGECSRSFYVGTEITEDDINAEFKNGILRIDIPKMDNKKLSEKKQIFIK